MSLHDTDADTAPQTLTLPDTDTDTDTDPVGPDALQVPVTDDLVIDLLEDAREVGGVLGYGYPAVPPARRPDLAAAAASLDGYGEYGS